MEAFSKEPAVKVCVVSSGKPDVYPHGLEQAAWKFGREMAKRGATIHLVYDYDAYPVGPEEMVQDQVAFHGVRSKGRNRFSRRLDFFRNASSMLRLLHEQHQFDLFMIYGLEMMPLGKLLHRTGMSTVLYIPCSPLVEVKGYLKEMLLPPSVDLILHYSHLVVYEPLFLHYFDLVIAPSPYEFAELVRLPLGLGAKRTAVVPLGQDFNDELEEADQRHVALDLSARKDSVVERTDRGTKTILSVGENWARKGHDVLVRALREVKEEVPSRLVLVSTKHPHLDKLAKTLGLIEGEDIIFTGHLSRDEMVRQFASCDVFAYMARHDAYSLITLEALAAGKPVVVSPIVERNNPAVKRGGNALVASPSDVPGLARELKLLLSDEALRTRMGEEGKMMAAKFTWERVSDEMLKTLQSLLEAGPTVSARARA